MDTVDPARFILASFVVLGLLGILALGLKRYAGRSFMQKSEGRLAILETQYIDHKSKIILVKRDDVQHLILISNGQTTIIESGIKKDA